MRIKAKTLLEILNDALEKYSKIEIHSENTGCSIWISDEVLAEILLKKSE